MFTIPDLTEESPSLDENVEALLESVVKEEEAMAKLVCLEAEKVKRFAGGVFDFAHGRSPTEILSFVQSTKRISDLITLKGMFLIQRLQNIFLIENRMMCTLTKQVGIRTDLKRLRCAVDEYLLLIESLTGAMEFSSDPSFVLSCKFLSQIRRQMSLLTDKPEPKKPQVRVLYPEPPPLPGLWKPKKNPGIGGTSIWYVAACDQADDASGQTDEAWDDGVVLRSFPPFHDHDVFDDGDAPRGFPRLPQA